MEILHNDQAMTCPVADQILIQKIGNYHQLINDFEATEEKIIEVNLAT